MSKKKETEEKTVAEMPLLDFPNMAKYDSLIAEQTQKIYDLELKLSEFERKIEKFDFEGRVLRTDVLRNEITAVVSRVNDLNSLYDSRKNKICSSADLTLERNPNVALKKAIDSIDVFHSAFCDISAQMQGIKRSCELSLKELDRVAK